MFRRHRTATAIAGLAASAAIAACGGATSETGATAESSAATDAATAVEPTDATTDGTTVGSTAEAPSGDVLPASTFEGTATTVDGESFDLGQLAGTDVILWFWAPW